MIQNSFITLVTIITIFKNLFCRKRDRFTRTLFTSFPVSLKTNDSTLGGYDDRREGHRLEGGNARQQAHHPCDCSRD